MTEVHQTVTVGDIAFANNRPLVLIGGVNVLESEQFALDVAGHYADVCARLNIPLVFKASYDKANRSSIHSYRGPGMEQGLAILAAVKRELGLPVITDVHAPDEAAPLPPSATLSSYRHSWHDRQIWWRLWPPRVPSSILKNPNS